MSNISSGFAARVKLAADCAEERLRLRPYDHRNSIRDRASAAGAIAGADVNSLPPEQDPLVGRFANAGYLGGAWPDVDFYYSLSFWRNNPNLNPFDYYSLVYENGFIEITSRELHEAEGRLSLKAKDACRLLSDLDGSYWRHYSDWADDPYPVECGVTLLRIDCGERYGQIEAIVERHPSGGSLYLGSSEHELKQLAALLKLSDSIENLVRLNTPTADDREKARARAHAIIGKAGLSFIPSDGYCGRCGADVTLTLADIELGESITGCPICARSWCE